MDGNTDMTVAELPAQSGASLAQKSTLYIEIEDLLGFLEAHKTLSGIQRVQSGIISYIFDSNPDHFNDNLFVINKNSTKQLAAVSTERLAKIVNYASKPDVSHTKLRALIHKARRSAKICELRKNSTYLILGAFWGYGTAGSRYRFIKQAGIEIVVLIYNLIPINNSEYCDAGLAHDFSMSFAEMMHLSDRILTISDYTKQEVIDYFTRHGLPSRSIEAVPLAHTSETDKYKTDYWSDCISFLKNQRFVLFVSTIEARKNHQLLVTAWKQFLHEGMDVPYLVFVGRPGWRVTSLMEQLENAHYYNGKVIMLHDMSDAELATLYRNCMFTTYPSFIEGWGLPVGEGLKHGRPCLSSLTSSLPEVGKNLVDYIDPWNIRESIEKIRMMLIDISYLEERAFVIKKTFIPRSWLEVGRDLLSQAANSTAQSQTRNAIEAQLKSGMFFRIGSLTLGNALPADYPKHPIRLIFIESWYGVEQIGAWMQGNQGTLRFMSELTPNKKIILYFQLIAPPWAGFNNAVRVTVNDTISTQINLRPGAFNVRFQGEVGFDGVISISLNVTGHVPLEDENDSNSRRFLLGLSGLGYAAQDDTVSRLNIIDTMIFS